MSFWKAFFQPFRLALGAAVFFVIFNPGVLFSILMGFWHLISSSWLISAIVSVVVFGLLIDQD